MLPPAANAQVKEGDDVSVHFTCKLKNGQVVASSLKELPQNLQESKSTVFMQRGVGEPIEFKTGEDLSKSDQGKGGSFESVIISKLAPHVIGMKEGEKKTVALEAERQKAENPADNVLQMARVRRRPKQVRMTPEEFKQRKGSDPEIGQSFTADPSFPGKVVQVTDSEVVIEHTPPSDGQVQTPFGKGTVKESGNVYLIDIDAKVGTLVRSGPMVGRIVEVGEGETGTITIDYSHPFGGETLDCDVTLEGIGSEAKSQ